MAHIISLLNSAELGFLFRETEGDSKEQPPWAPCFKSWVQGHLNKGCKRVYKASQQIWFSPYWVLKKMHLLPTRKNWKIKHKHSIVGLLWKTRCCQSEPIFPSGDTWARTQCQVVLPCPVWLCLWANLSKWGVQSLPASQN